MRLDTQGNLHDHQDVGKDHCVTRRQSLPSWRWAPAASLPSQQLWLLQHLAPVACNRQCLIDKTDAYVAALVAHDIAKAPLSDQIVFVENATRSKPGEGLWKSIVKGPSTFSIHVPDEVNQAAGYLAMVTYMGPPQAPQGCFSRAACRDCQAASG